MVDPFNQLAMTTVLVVFQQRAVADWIGDCLQIRDCLEEAGYAVAVAKGYDDALRTLSIIEPDAMVVGASKLDGHTEAFLGRLDRNRHASGMPTIVVSPAKAKAALARIAALRNPRIGYLSWPLRSRDLRLIVQDLLQTDRQPVKPIPGRCVVLDPRFRVLRGRAGVTIVTPDEYRLADYLISQRGRPVAFREIEDRVFSFCHDTPALVRAHVTSLRQKVKIVTGGNDLIRPVGRGGIVYLGGREAARLTPRFS